MADMREQAERFFEACEGGRGWAECSRYCHPEATFSAQANVLGAVRSLQDYTEWMRSMYVPMPDAAYEVLSFAVDEARQNVTVAGVFRATHTAEGGPVPPTGKRVEADYAYIMNFDGDRITHMTKIWNDAFSMQQVGWA